MYRPLILQALDSRCVIGAGGKGSVQEFKINHELPLPEVLKAEYPVSDRIREIKQKRDEEIRDIFTGKKDKFIVLVGPCSADNEESVCEYTRRLKKVSDQVADRVLVIPRVYTNKPRTTGDGYKGMLHQPDPEKEPDLLAGIIAIRKMHIRVMEETGLSTADEMLYPENRSYLDDVLSYEAIGARSVENQQHRLVASGIGLQVFMTGRGTPYGLDIAPVIKVCSRNEMKDHWFDMIDISAGAVATGEKTIAEVGTEIFHFILDVAGGTKQPWSDQHGFHNDMCIFNPAPIT